ncbi:uncharacterized protein C8R40DRAFT_1105716 [Lentinula edodes]|uniref:uncharacterized protein n=1 Tax=Lentinula edodes TaxID=5353 RepID=UPI001E8E778D|nr:uncharacterized protein C8R40DRAFT_1105716 [Lentinula edodes]KAH7875285.1 hypothetical protein C8R40DRAFT_1105716 [Lentinula edodes]
MRLESRGKAKLELGTMVRILSSLLSNFLLLFWQYRSHCIQYCISALRSVRILRNSQRVTHSRSYHRSFTLFKLCFPSTESFKVFQRL